jgi:hypothetical protein
MVVGYQQKQRLEQGERHEISPRVHRDARGFQAHFDITEHTDPGVTLALDFFESTDQGQTWRYSGGQTLEGGRHTIDKNGDAVTYVHFVCAHAQAPQRLVRGLIHVLPTRPPFIAGIRVPGAPAVTAFGQAWKPTLERDYLHVDGEPLSVPTRIHLFPTPTGQLVKGRIPTS